MSFLGGGSSGGGQTQTQTQQPFLNRNIFYRF